MKRLHRGPEWRWLVTLGGIALLVRLVWVVLMADRVPQFDEVRYLELASRLAAGEGYVDESGSRVAFWPVGYPALLSLVFRLTGGSSLIAATAMQVILGVANCLLLSVVGSRMVGLGAGRLAGLLLALYPTHIFYSSLHLTELLFILLLLAAVGCLFWSRRPGVGWQIAGGVLLGLAALTRPLIVLLPLALPWGFGLRNRRLGQIVGATLIALVASLVVVSPWLARNHSITGRWTTLTTSGGFNFWVGNNPDARGGYDKPADFQEDFRTDEGFDWHRGYELGMEAIRADPGAALRRLPLKVSHLVALETDGVLWNLKGLQSRPRLPVTMLLLLLANGFYLAAVGSASLALLIRGNPPGLHRVTLLLVLYTVAIVLVFFGDPRFHLPLMPFLLLASATLFARGDRWCWPGWHDLLARSRGRRAAWVGLQGVLAGLMLLSLVVKQGVGAW